MVLNIVNGIKNNDKKKIFLSENGIAGFIFYALIISSVVYYFMNGKLFISAGILATILIICLGVILFKDKIANYISKKKEETNAELENITAFVGTNDFVAIGIMDAITSLGYRIPEDFSVCGFDNTLVASFSGISLTTIDHCIGEKGAYAVSMLRNQRTRMEQKDDKKEKKRPIMRLEYEPQLIIRHSTGKRK